MEGAPHASHVGLVGSDAVDMPRYRINPSNGIVFAFVFGTRTKNLQLELQRQRPADSDAFVPKHLSLSPAAAVGVIPAAAVQSLCSLTATAFDKIPVQPMS